LKNDEKMKVVTSFLCKTDEEILAKIDEIGDNRGSYDYDIDGAVIKIDQVAYRDDFPAGSKYSAGHIAYKYPPEEKETTITDIELSVGMTGRINPTAIFEPIRLCGTTVSRATLHNQDFIDKLGIGIGKTVLVYKSGEIIPKIKAVVDKKENNDIAVYQIPNVCPICGMPAVREEDTADIKCTNDDCPAKLIRRIVNFVQRDAMDIKGFGEEYVKALIEEGYLHNIADIYTLKEHRDELVQKGIIGKETNTDKILGVIDNSKNNEPYRLLVGLSIPNVGKTSAKTIMKHFESFDKLMKATVEELTMVNDVGETTAICIHDFFDKESSKELMKRFSEYGLTLEAESISAGNELEGMTFVITGDVTRFKNRNELVEFIEAHGGKAAGSVSRKTTALINNDVASNSGKNKKAKELGIEIISEDTFLERLNNA
nr:NAD-dependent DNA ligase LigA [Butyrivibrio sp.]